MHAEYPIVDDDTQSEEVEHVRKVLPDARTAVLALTFGVEAVGL
jgi:hypothetical protein